MDQIITWVHSEYEHGLQSQQNRKPIKAKGNTW